MIAMVNKLFNKAPTVLDDINQYNSKDRAIQNSEAFMIGDTIHDIKMGKNAKINTIGVTWGYNTKEELYQGNADHIINDPRELVKILGKY